MDISKSLNICLQRENMSKGDLAKNINVTPQTVTSLAKCNHCSHSNLIKMCNLFKMKASEFIALGENDPGD